MLCLDNCRSQKTMSVPISSAPNLEQQYDAVIGYIAQFREFSVTTSRRHLLGLHKNPWLKLTNALKILTQRDLLSGRNPAYMKWVFNGVTTPEEQKTQWFPIIISD